MNNLQAETKEIGKLMKTTSSHGILKSLRNRQECSRLGGTTLVCLAVLLVSLMNGQPAAGPAAVIPPAGWHLVWSDEFNQPDGSPPDPAKWGCDTGGGGWGNNEMEYYTDRTNNARIEDGKLVIEARRENFGGKQYTSARLRTLGKASWTCGRFEARIKIPRGQGIWPAFWMLGTNINSVGWPACGEIDIMENIGKEPDTVHGTVHGPGYSGLHGIGGPVTLPGGTAVADGFHVFAVDCESNQITWFMDGRPYFNITPARLPQNARWVFNRPKFIILNLAVGGYWPGYPDATTKFPQRMVLDYVRVYEKTSMTKTDEPMLLKTNQ
jgi:beta-glucanase (GH16 family)